MLTTDFYSNKYNNMLILGDFNMSDKDHMLPLMDGHKLYNMREDPTCFKTKEWKCIDLFPKYSDI